MRLYIYKGQVTQYSISNNGELYNNTTKKFLKGQISKNGYRTYNIIIGKLSKRLYTHRMVAETYLPTGNQNLEVHHKNGNKLDNFYGNLEWISVAAHGELTGKTNFLFNKKVYQFDRSRVLVATYPTIRECVRLNHFDESNLIRSLKRENKTLSHGYYWSYYPDNNFTAEEIKHSPNQRKVGQYTLEGLLINTFSSMKEAERETRVSRARISECCNNKRNNYQNYIWKFLD